jgi:hypothetical protein
MRKILYSTLFLASLLGATAFGIGIAAGIGSPPSLMSKTDYRDAGKVIDADLRLADAECRGHVNAAKDICMAESAGVDRIRKAELEVSYRGTAAAIANAGLARARAGYDIAKAKCGDRAEKLRSECLTAARSW